MIEQAILCLALNIYHEARGEPLEGQFAVALVTLNRAKRQPGNVCRVVYAPFQFSWTLSKNLPILETKAFLKAKQVAQRAFSLHDFTDGATHFHAHYVAPAWRHGMQVQGKWGNHIFYRSVK